VTIKPKAISFGLACFVVISLPFYLALAFQWSIGEFIVKVYWWLQYAALAFSGAVTAYSARQNEIENSISLGIVIAIFLGIFNYTWSTVGLPSDAFGLEGNIFLVLLSLPITVSLSAVGAICVRFWRKRARA
jgi:hypothetical protein